MSGVGDSQEVHQLAKDFSAGLIEEGDYRSQRAEVIDRYCGIEPQGKLNPQIDIRQPDEHTFVFYSVLGILSTLMIFFIAYLFAQ